MSIIAELKYFGQAVLSSGTATIPADPTGVGPPYVDVPHTLGFVPDINKIKLTMKTNLDGRDVWLSNITTANLRINISNTDPLTAFDFGYAILR